MSETKSPTWKDIVIRHQELIDILLFALADHASAVIRSLPGCHSCENAATVANQYTGAQACDRCCAESIVVNKENPLVWLDLPDALEIRRIQQHREQSISERAVVH